MPHAPLRALARTCLANISQQAVIRYEAMQLDIQAEIEKLLVAIGAPSTIAASTAAAAASARSVASADSAGAGSAGAGSAGAGSAGSGSAGSGFSRPATLSAGSGSAGATAASDNSSSAQVKSGQVKSSDGSSSASWMQRALYQARAVIGEHPNHPMADEQHGLSTEGAAGRGKRADKVAGDKAATGRAAEQAGMEALVKAGPEDAVDTLANWEEVEAVSVLAWPAARRKPYPCPCSPSPLPLRHPPSSWSLPSYSLPAALLASTCPISSPNPVSTGVLI